MRSAPSRLIQASAGTGKTYALSGQFISLLLAGEDPSTILASTFTRKAAGEILERIYLRLARAVRDSSARKELAQQLSIKTLESTHILKALDRLIDHQHKLKVSTLDAFASSVARLFSEEIGLPHAWSIQDQPASQAQLSSAVAAICSTIEAEDMANLVTTLKYGETKRSIAASIEGIVGSLLGILQETDPSCWSWLKVSKLSLSNKSELVAALQLAELPKTKSGEPNKTYAKAVSEVLELFEFERWGALIEVGLIQKAHLDQPFAKNEIPASLSVALKEICLIASSHCLYRLAEANRAAYGLLLGVSSELSKLEESSGQVSFERINRRVVELGASLFSNELYFRLDTGLHHILLDEFQDTSLLQWKLLEPLVDEKLSSSEVESSFFCVGDGKQAIYGWRGGTTKIFDSVPVRWRQLALETREASYRSQPAIIELVNSIFSSLEQNPSLEIFYPAIRNWLSRFRPHTTAVARPQLDTQINPVTMESIDAEVDSEAYYQAFFVQLKQIVQSDPLASIGILVRSNKEVSKVLDFAQSYNFDLSAQGGTPLTRFSVITSLLALLSLIDNPGNSIKQFEVNCSSWISSKSLTDLVAETKKLLLTCGLARTLQKIVSEQTQMLSQVEKKAVEQLFAIAIKFELSESSLDLAAFIRGVEGSSVENIGSSRVQVLTIHKSKGLEFDIVVIPDIAWDFKPKQGSDYLIERDEVTLAPVKVSLYAKQELRIFSKDLSSMAEQYQQEHFEESLSLLYVALTRARSRLHIYLPAETLKSKTLTAASVVTFVHPATSINLKQVENALKAISKPPAKLKDIANLNLGAVLIQEKGLLKASPRKTRGLARQSPSSHIKQHDRNANSREAEYFGTAIHKLFSLTPWIDEVPSTEVQLQAVASIGRSESKAEGILAAFAKYLLLPELRVLMSRPPHIAADKIEIYREKPFVFRAGNSLVQGRIDRISIADGKGLVLDFKVGSSPAAAHIKGYLDQLSDYKNACSALFPKVQFEAALFFLGDGKKISLG